MGNYKEGNAKQELANTVEKMIRDNCTGAFSLEELAMQIHINKFHMLRTFKDVKGETPLHFHNRCRCEKAMEMLKNPDLSISYVALETGFNSPSHFSRVFLDITGFTPSEYRKKYREE